MPLPIKVEYLSLEVFAAPEIALLLSLISQNSVREIPPISSIKYAVEGSAGLLILLNLLALTFFLLGLAYPSHKKMAQPTVESTTETIKPIFSHSIEPKTSSPPPQELKTDEIDLDSSASLQNDTSQNEELILMDVEEESSEKLSPFEEPTVPSSKEMPEEIIKLIQTEPKVDASSFNPEVIEQVIYETLEEEMKKR